MGRVKLELKKIQNHKSLLGTYSKRSAGLIKKAHELSVLCDVDIGIIMFSPSGKLDLFCKDDKIEDVITRFANTPLHMRTRGKHVKMESPKEAILKLNSGREMVDQESGIEYRDHILELQSTLEKVLEEKEYFEKKASLFDAAGKKAIESMTSVSRLVGIERELEQALVQIRGRKRQVVQNGSSDSVHMLMEMQNQGATSYSTDGPSPVSSFNGGQDSHVHSWMDGRFKQEYKNLASTSIVSIMSSSQATETRVGSESSSFFYQGTLQTQRLPSDVHGNHLSWRGSNGQSNINSFKRVKTGGGAH